MRFTVNYYAEGYTLDRYTQERRWGVLRDRERYDTETVTPSELADTVSETCTNCEWFSRVKVEGAEQELWWEDFWRLYAEPLDNGRLRWKV